jgi:hypothetical protein
MKRVFAGALVLMILAGGFYYLKACGWEPAVEFTLTARPDWPYEDFLKGKLGVLQRTYHRTYLYAAYRILSGKPFTPEDQRRMMVAWTGHPTSEDVKKAAGTAPSSNVFREWQTARMRVPGARPPFGQDASPYHGDTVEKQVNSQDYAFFTNCLSDAFRNATIVLNARIQRFGLASPEVKEWLRGQDVVFRNCEGGSMTPSAVPAGIDPLIVADRDYQIAAAQFYAGELEQAQKKFALIAADSSSPWRNIAPFLGARCLLRRATLDGQSGVASPFLD